jgi:hypothetical protein
MKIYQINNSSGKIVSFARSFDQARAVVREDSPTAKKIYSNAELTEFSSGFCIYGIDIKPDKEGILSKLNSLLSERPSQSSQPEPMPEPVQQPVADVGSVFSVKDVETIPVGISPAIEFTGKGSGTCLHCKKTVGYVGGFPRVNPPDELRDN